MHLQYYNYLLCEEDQFPLQMTVEHTYAIAGKKEKINLLLWLKS